MIRILRRKFIITAMLAITILLLVLLAVINIGNFTLNSQRANQVLDNLVESEGLYTPPKEAPIRFYQKPPPGPWPKVPALPTADDMLGARYFFVRFDIDGSITSIDMSHIHAVTEPDAQEMAQLAYNGGADSGQVNQFRFRVTQTLDGQRSFVVFLDISNQIRSITAIFTISAGISVLCWISMLLLVILLSQRAIKPIAENIEKQKQFVTNAGHEIKTPLSIILINTDALELHLGKNKWSQNIRAQAVRLNGLMQNLLVLAKMDESAGRLPASTFSASLLLEELVHPYYEIAAEKGISLQTGLQPDVTLHANRESIMQLFSILLDNAAKYTPPGGHISVLLASKGKHVMFQMENTCCSLQEIDFAKLFDRFYRCDSARTQKDGGYGIGLSAAQAIVHAHGGTISASAEKDRTILFSVRLKCSPRQGGHGEAVTDEAILPKTKCTK